MSTKPKTVSKNEIVTQTLGRIAKTVERRLRGFFTDLSEEPPSPYFETQTSRVLLDQIKDLTLRSGKRLRPALLISGARLFDHRAEEYSGVIDAAAAIELLQTYFLIHDDIMDQDIIRRGGPAVHVALAGFSGNSRMGENLGILAGDMASALREILLTNMAISGSRYKKLQKIFSAMHLDVIHGQVLDVLEKSPSFEVATHKTASYTTIGPLIAGATLVGAGDDEVAHLAKIALPLGIAFQFRDDLLGTFGSPSVTGKPASSDLKEGKRTALLEEGRARADKLQRKLIDQVVGNTDASDQEVEAARNALDQCGAKSACQQHIEELTCEFVDGLDNPQYTEETVLFLTGLANFIAERDQ